MWPQFCFVGPIQSLLGLNRGKPPFDPVDSGDHIDHCQLSGVLIMIRPKLQKSAALDRGEDSERSRGRGTACTGHPVEGLVYSWENHQTIIAELSIGNKWIWISTDEMSWNTLFGGMNIHESRWFSCHRIMWKPRFWHVLTYNRTPNIRFALLNVGLDLPSTHKKTQTCWNCIVKCRLLGSLESLGAYL